MTPESGELRPVFSFHGAIDPLGRVMRISLETDHIVRLDADGQPDASFGDEGEAELPDSFDPFVVDATETGVVVGGDVAGEFAVVKLTDGGAIDDEFGDGGIALLGGAELGRFVADVDLAYVIAQSASGFGPLTGPLTVGP